MRTKIALEIILNGCRWTSNILTELLGNYSTLLSPPARDALRKAISSLGDCLSELYSQIEKE